MNSIGKIHSALAESIASIEGARAHALVNLCGNDDDMDDFLKEVIQEGAPTFVAVADDKGDEGESEVDDEEVEVDPDVESFLRYLDELVAFVAEAIGVDDIAAVDEMVYDVIDQAAADGTIPPLPDLDVASSSDLSAWVTAVEGARIGNLVADTIKSAFAEDETPDGGE
jgi:hypothetical protein